MCMTAEFWEAPKQTVDDYRSMVRSSIELPFEPHPFLRNPHAQTVAAVYLPGKKYPYRARHHAVSLADGDQIVLHDDCPTAWQPGDRVALLLHGLGGSHRSSGMVRIAGKLNALGLRTFRKDLRGYGAGVGLARWPFHSGRSDDADAALDFIAQHCPGSPVTLIGFSLGGNIALKLLGEKPDAVRNVELAITVCPPIDLHASCRNLLQPNNRLYDRRFVAQLLRQYAERRRLLPDAPYIRLPERPQNLWELDDKLTAPICGFEGAEDYYRRSSASQFLSRVDVPTRILIAQDDPLVPAEQFERCDVPPSVQICMTERGGHLGFIGRRGKNGDRRWMDGRIIDWVQTVG